jgi:hypothetical protein
MLRRTDQPYIAGYANRMSVRPGDPLVVHAASWEAPSCYADVYRVTGRTPGGFWPQVEFVSRGAAVRPVMYEESDSVLPLGPGDADVTGCAWEPTTVVDEIPAAWGSGLYLVQFTTSSEPTHRASTRLGQDAMFVLRPDRPGERSPVLVQVDVGTWNAYTVWHHRNLYHARGPSGEQIESLRAHTVSFHRPGIGFERNDNNPWGTPPAAYHWAFIEWARQQDLVFDYCTGLDLHTGGVRLQDYRAVVTVGHDEYWTRRQRDAVEEFVGAGGNAIFFGGNLAFFQIRLNEADNSISCYKRSSTTSNQRYTDPGTLGPPLDPLYRDPAAYPDHDNSDCTVETCTSPLHRPTPSLTGLSGQNDGMFSADARRDDGVHVFAAAAWWWEEYGGPSRPAKGFTVLEPDHWIFEGTDLKAGDVFGEEQKVIGYECDGLDVEFVDGVPVPTGRDGAVPGTRILAFADCREWGEIDYSVAPSTRVEGRMGTACSFGGVVPIVAVERPSGGVIVNTGCTDWPFALVDTYDNTDYRSTTVRIRPQSPDVQTITRNVIRRLGGI